MAEQEFPIPMSRQNSTLPRPYDQTACGLLTLWPSGDPVFTWLRGNPASLWQSRNPYWIGTKLQE